MTTKGVTTQQANVGFKKDEANAGPLSASRWPLIATMRAGRTSWTIAWALSGARDVRVHSAPTDRSVAFTVGELTERFDAFNADRTKGKDATRVRVVVEC